jgi:hypothetical protein
VRVREGCGAIGLGEHAGLGRAASTGCAEKMGG